MGTIGYLRICYRRTSASISAWNWAHNTDLPGCSFDIEKCLVTPMRAQFRSGAGACPWILWTVLVVPESSIGVVFDECSSQFGLVENGNFEGFNGTFVQTLNDLSKALG